MNQPTAYQQRVYTQRGDKRLVKILLTSDYRRGHTDGYAEGKRRRVIAPTLAKAVVRITTPYGTGFRHGVVDGVNNVG